MHSLDTRSDEPPDDAAPVAGGAPGRGRVTTARRRALYAGITLLASTAVSLLAMEGVVRILEPVSEVRAHFRPGIFRPDPELGWALVPGYRGLRVEDDRSVPTTTNALGYRGPEWTASRRRASVRVLVLGDSVAFGLGVRDEETYPAHLEALLRERGADAAVFNSGVPGYDTLQEGIVFRRLADEVQPGVVVVTWLYNDILPQREAGRAVQVLDGYLVDDVERYRVWRDGIDHRGLYASALYRFTRVRWRLLRDHLGLRQRSWSAGVDDELYRPSLQAISRLAEQTRARGASPLLVVIPRREHVAGSVSAEGLSYVADFGRSQGMEVVEMLPAWSERGAEARRNFLNDNVHLTARGYREVAEMLARTPLAR
jgi:lysophospholipase L1-like esterase